MEGDNKAIIVSDNKANAFTGPVTVSKVVTIFRKESSSAYFKRNAKNMPEGKNKIGVGINSVNRMKTNMDELDVYMPKLLGISRNDPKYNELVDTWFNNIGVFVPEGGLPLEVGFVYNDVKFKESVESVENDIYARFNSAKKGNPQDRDAAIDLRDAEIINLEKTKYKYGLPINVGNYILWRYALVYSDVANDIALINKTGNIRFYIYDPVREKYKEKIQFDLRNKASKIYVQLLDNPNKVENMLWVDRGTSVDITKVEFQDKIVMLDNLARANPSEFIKLYSDENLDIKATIERMIHYGILKRLPNTNVIVDENNDIVGNSMDEAIIFFKNTERNKAAITRFQARLKTYTHD